MSSASQRQAIRNFKNVTSSSDKVARDVLSKHGWNVEQSLDYFYSNRHLFPAQKQGDKKKLNKLFDEYKDEDDPDCIFAPDLFRFLKDIGIDSSKTESFGVAWRLGCQEMGSITRDEFVNGFSNLGVDTLPKIRAEMDTLRKQLQDPNQFRPFYQWLFTYANEGKKTILKAKAVALWKLVLSDWALNPQWCAFAGGEDNGLKAVSKDLWQQVLEFSREFKTDLSSYDEENGAWPVLIDEFVEYVKNGGGDEEKKEEEE